MSERKVLTKYYPPDFDPSKLEKRRKGPKQQGPKVQTVRLMAPFSMKCTSCGEYIYKGRKFNARKETTSEQYLDITIFRFYIRCTRCSAEITFKTDPKRMDYECERGARRNFEMWRQEGDVPAVESEEEMLQRIKAKEEELDGIGKLERKTEDAKTEMRIADQLDEIRTANANRARAEKEGVVVGVRDVRDEEREAVERELEEQAKMAFTSGDGEVVRRVWTDEELGDGSGGLKVDIVPSFQRQKKAKKDFASSLGIKKAAAANAKAAAEVKAAPTPTSEPVKLASAQVAAPKKASLMVDYGSDDED